MKKWREHPCSRVFKLSARILTQHKSSTDIPVCDGRRKMEGKSSRRCLQIYQNAN
ncbi:MAG TPA: hypothetical protein PLW02_06040 [Verrucomicrobiota bacterium]|nr:hypothetical protein [Verrucomicrobiota bacterium]